jgi:hypothetical protein
MAAPCGIRAGAESAPALGRIQGCNPHRERPKLAAIHEGGYSSSYVPFCGAAVIEGLLGLGDKVVEDPFIEAFRGIGYVELQPHQEAVIEDAAGRLRTTA